MVDVNKIRGKMAEHGYTIKRLAQEMEIDTRKLSKHLNDGNFGINDAEKLISILSIENPSEIFFVRK